jgi:ABC-type transport system involved in cytochrome bd biosynthesis fused ATPase/permease subunit
MQGVHNAFLPVQKQANWSFPDGQYPRAQNPFFMTWSAIVAFVGYSRAIRCIVLIVFILAPLESLASATANDKKVPKEIKRYAEKIERAEKKSCNAQPGKSAAKRYRIWVVPHS